MKVFNRTEFMKLPEGTFFAKVPTPVIIDGLHIKGDTMGTDWAHLSVVDWQANDTGDWIDRYHRMAEDGISVPSNDMYGRDGSFTPTDMFLVFEREDLELLRAWIDAALTLPELPSTTKLARED